MSIPSETPARVGDAAIKAGERLTTASKTAVNASLDAAKTSADATHSLTQKTADAAQAATRKATERAAENAQAWSAGAAEAMQRSGQGIQAMAGIGMEAADRLREMSSEYVSLAQQSAERGLERVQALSTAGSPEAFMAAQRTFIWGGLEDLAEAQQRLAKLTWQLWEDSLNRLTTAPRAMANAVAA